MRLKGGSVVVEAEVRTTTGWSPRVAEEISAALADGSSAQDLVTESVIALATKLQLTFK